MQIVSRHHNSLPGVGRLIQLLALLLIVQLMACAQWQLRRSPGEPDPRYYTYDQIVDLFSTWEAGYPDIFHTEYIGKTGSGRDSIIAARISLQSPEQDARPALIFHAAQHSNECNGTNAIIEMMTRLITEYGRDTYYTSMVDGLNIWFIPVVNVDGHRKVFGGYPGWVDWRKTMRDNDASGGFSGFDDGVDLNRNWDYRWHDYPQYGPEHSMYKGPHPFSEVETVALRDFILRENPLFLVDYHSPGVVTPGNVIFSPWVDKETGYAGVDFDVYGQIGRSLAARLRTEVDSLFYENTASYNTLPKEQCWVYANTGLCVLLMEISSQFWWEGSIVETIAQRVAYGSFYLMEHALSGPGITGRVTEAGTGRPVVAEIQVAEAHDPEIGPRLCNRTGRYWRLLGPGEYTVTACLQGQYSEPRRVAISGSEWVTADFVFPPRD